MIGPLDPRFPPFVGSSAYIRGLNVGISLASAAMGEQERDAWKRELWLGEGEHEIEIGSGTAIHLHDCEHITINNGLDAETVERLIKLAVQGKEAAA